MIAARNSQGQLYYECAFNTQACEHLNAWLGGFDPILRRMTPGNFDQFLHAMLFYHTMQVLKKQSMMRMVRVMRRRRTRTCSCISIITVVVLVLLAKEKCKVPTKVVANIFFSMTCNQELYMDSTWTPHRLHIILGAALFSFHS